MNISDETIKAVQQEIKLYRFAGKCTPDAPIR